MTLPVNNLFNCSLEQKRKSRIFMSYHSHDLSLSASWWVKYHWTLDCTLPQETPFRSYLCVPFHDPESKTQNPKPKTSVSQQGYKLDLRELPTIGLQIALPKSLIKELPLSFQSSDSILNCKNLVPCPTLLLHLHLGLNKSLFMCR